MEIPRSRGMEMLRTILLAVAIGLTIGTVPAFAQGKKVSCEKICALRCQSSAAKSACRDRCLPACAANHGQ